MSSRSDWSSKPMAGCASTPRGVRFPCPTEAVADQQAAGVHRNPSNSSGTYHDILTKNPARNARSGPTAAADVTLRQRAWLGAIQTYWRENRVAPTLRELLDDLGLSSTNAAAEMVERLREKGLVEVGLTDDSRYQGRGPAVCRTLRLTDAGEAVLR